MPLHCSHTAPSLLTWSLTSVCTWLLSGCAHASSPLHMLHLLGYTWSPLLSVHMVPAPRCAPGSLSSVRTWSPLLSVHLVPSPQCAHGLLSSMYMCSPLLNAHVVPSPQCACGPLSSVFTWHLSSMCAWPFPPKNLYGCPVRFVFQCSLVIRTSGELTEVTVATSFLTRLIFKCLLPNTTTFCGAGSETSAEELGEEVD